MEQEKQVVYFSDLFFAVLKRWKAIVACALILAAALGGFALWKASKKGDSAAAEDAAKAVEYNQAQLDIISANILSQQKYMTESVLMTMDPYSYGDCCCMFGKPIMASAEDYAAMKAKGVQPWAGASVKDEATVDGAIEKGAYLITCNNPDVVLALLRERGKHA